MSHASVRRLLPVLPVVAAAALCGVAEGAGARPDARIAVLVSQDAEPYQDALAGLRRHLKAQGSPAPLDVYPLHGEAAAADAALQAARKASAGLLVTLGSVATQAAIRQAPDTPIVASMILNADDLAKTPNATAVVLEFPVDVQFRWMQKLLPGPKRIGVLFNAAENQGRIDAATRAVKALGLTLNARRLDSPRDLPDALEGLATQADVLWGVADQVALTPQTAQPILLFSLRNRIPFVGLSMTWVKAGALYALDRDYEDIGAQCGELVLRILHGTAPASLPPEPPRKVTYAVNMRTARHMKVEIPRALLEGAQSVVE
jgi:putative ABC transport system substrate-binding protein